MERNTTAGSKNRSLVVPDFEFFPAETDLVQVGCSTIEL